ncbi:uncharacterized protein DUF4124 [Luteimonas cucumeris]|uniref:Uncharacterized protein DUF4124 n=1 Tax=Luteimonas cucumeris TaxID=985012 RepID=A0A562L215_9GAMM|nr:DUF4124 domain-containing protein [Luteimonas cucumeris]TWI01675.1 uncharacterized protein DUF4124 [Luteimonas cucumeris]
MRPWHALVLASTLLALPAVDAADKITLYRCVDAKGKLTLRDTPCAPGEVQQTRTFQRPRDPPPRPAAQVETAPTPAPPPPEVRYVTVNPPRPLYECVTPDGERYTSDTDAGNPRWVPLWTLGYPSWSRRTIRSEGLVVSRPIRPPDIGPPTRPRPVNPALYSSGTVIADECHPLPQEEVCARLNDRRYEIKRRYLNAMPSERAVLDEEERALIARMRNDCGTD